VSDPVEVLEDHFGAESRLSMEEVDALRAALSLDGTIESPVAWETSGQFVMPSLGIDAERVATMLEQLARRSLLDRNLDNATTFFRLALRCWMRIEGSRGAKAVSCAHELAVAERNAGGFEMARSLLNAILAIRNETLGDADPETLMTVNDLAVVELDLDDATAARGRLTAAIKVSAQTCGVQDENTLKLEGNLADALRRLGELEEALGIESRVLKARRNALGDEHPEVLDAMNNLAATHLELGQLPEARALQEEVLRLRRLVLPRDHADTMTAMANLAVTLYRMGRFQDAVGLERRVVADRKRVLGSDHPDTWMAANNLSGSLRDIGETAEAKWMLEEVLQRSMEQLGPEHQYVLLAETNLADACSKTGDYERAYELATHAWTIRKEKEGLNHPFTLLSEATVAAVLFEMGQAEQALNLQNHVVSAREDALGPDHFDTLGARNDLGKLLWRKGELDRARRIYEDVLERGCRVLGVHHPDILTTRLNLSEVFFQLGDAERARGNAWPIAQQISGKSVVYGDDYELASRSFALLVRTEPAEELQPLFEGVSLAMWNALEVRTHDSLSPLWRHFAAFHETWQSFCLVQAFEDLPKALIALQGLEVSAGIIDDFSSEDPTPQKSAMAAARQSLADVRVRMEQLDSQLARVSEEAQIGLPRIAERRRAQFEAERSLQVTEERDAVRRYEEAKDTLAAAEPSLAGVLRPPRPTASDLEKTLASGETLVLVWRSSDGYVASTIGAGMRGHVSLPDFNSFLEASCEFS
jgi:tetratricopeptide (TPR) repeat protein